MLLGYNTNGLAHHRWDDALTLIAEAGYRSVALTIDHHCLAPWSANRGTEVAQLRSQLQRYGLACVIETGARFLLDPRRKHQPTLISQTETGRDTRQAFLRDAVDLAEALDAQAVSFWSGTAEEGTPDEQAWTWLIDGCRSLTAYALDRHVRLAFEPEPGMLVETGDQYARLVAAISNLTFGLTLDIGHVHCLQDGTIAEHIFRWPERLYQLHLEDMRPGVHDHLPFGTGSIDFPPVFAALKSIDYQGCACVELSRHSHVAPQMLRESMAFLEPFLRSSGETQGNSPQ